MKRLLVAIWMMLCLSMPASAQLYKWVDSNGKVQYSDKPPPSNIKTEKLREAAPAPSPPPLSETKGDEKKDAAKAGPKTAAEQEQAFRKRKLDAAKSQEEQDKKQAQARDKEENCKRAKASLANLELGGRQMRMDEKGERVFLDDQQIAQEIVRVRKIAASVCD
jgi:hypothetical protein